MPDWRRELRQRAAALRVAPEDEQDVIEELAQHLEEEFAELAPRLGAAEAERRLRARLDDGALRDLARTHRTASRKLRPRRGLASLASPQHIWADVRYAMRRSRRHVAFTTVAVVSLALGIGANTAVFSLVDAVMLKRPPIPQRARVVQIYQHQHSFPYAPFSYPDYLSLKHASGSAFSQMSIAEFAVAPRDLGDHVETLFAEMVNGDYFPLLGLTAPVGRLLGPEDVGAEGANPVVVLSNDYWRSAFGSDRGVVGRQIQLAGRAYTIVGVAPADYQGTFPGIAPALYMPITMINQVQAGVGDQLAMRENHSAFLKVRLAPGVTTAQLRTLAANFTAEMQRRFPKSWTATTSTTVVPDAKVAVNPMIDGIVVPAAATLMVVVALVLLVACANLASFLLAQARDRQREIAIRVALGAGRWPLVRQLLTEALVLATVGGAVGVLLSRAALHALLAANLPTPIPIHVDTALDVRVLCFAMLASVAAALLVGVLPALQATRPDVVEVIKSENTGGGPKRRLTMRGALVAGQVAVSLVLLITATLFLRSLQARERIDPGFGHAPAGLVWFVIPPGQDSATHAHLLLDRIEARVRAIGGVRSVGATDNILLAATSTQGTYVNVPGLPAPNGQPGYSVDDAAADSAYFDAAGIRLLRGRSITASDGAKAPRVAVINEVMAQKLWPGRDPVDETFNADSITYRVVGIFQTTKVRSLGEAPRMFFFASLLQRPSAYVWLVARTAGNPDRTTPRMMAAMRDVDRSLMILQGTTMKRHLAAGMLPARLGAMAFGLFATLALALAMIGVYGVVSYAVARRAREVGIRMAMGAQPRAIVRLLMREGIAMVLAGSVVGLALALAVTRALSGLLTGVAAADPVTFVVAPLVLLLVGVVATFVPARRCTRTDPVRVLRSE
jgi:putative ABC transport system permease protein